MKKVKCRNFVEYITAVAESCTANLALNVFVLTGVFVTILSCKIYCNFFTEI